MKTKPKALVICADGINCEEETAHALNKAGFETSIKLTRQILNDPKQIKHFQIFVIPGGFSFGDEIYSGKVLSLTLEKQVMPVIMDFIDNNKIILGICNGFQVLVNLGLVPEPGLTDTCVLNHNKQHKFINRWVNLRANHSINNPLLQNLDIFELPIRHGEGNLTLKDDNLSGLINEHAALYYDSDVNGSFHKIAGLTNKNGNILGLMPHPEAFVTKYQHYNWSKHKDNNIPNPTPGFQIFLNAYNYVNC